MSYTFYYTLLAIIIIVFIVCIYFKPITFENVVIGIASIAYSMVYEILFGDRFKLYYYINPEVSTLLILISAIFIYPLLNVIFTLFIPQKIKSILLYSSLWTVVMLIFEFLSVKAGTVVFIGWRMFPWSVLTYIVTFGWIILFYRYLEKRIIKDKQSKDS